MVEHFRFEVLHDSTEVSLQDIFDLLYFFLVFPFAFQSFTGALAIFDMVFEADLEFSSFDIPFSEVERAGAQREELADEVEDNFEPCF